MVYLWFYRKEAYIQFKFYMLLYMIDAFHLGLIVHYQCTEGRQKTISFTTCITLSRPCVLTRFSPNACIALFLSTLHIIVVAPNQLQSYYLICSLIHTVWMVRSQWAPETPPDTHPVRNPAQLLETHTA